MSADLIGNPEKTKRGRPKGMRSVVGGIYDHPNMGDDYAFIRERMDRDLIRKYIKSREASGELRLGLTVLRAVATFPPEEHAELIDLFDQRGARWAKRYVQCKRNPPDVGKVAISIAHFVGREFPGVDQETINMALRIILEGDEDQ